MKLSKSLPLSLTLLLALPAAPQNAASNIAASASTAVPPLIPYSGVVNTVPGAQPSASASITFLIYKDEQGGEPFFAETQTVALDTTGHYKAQLGATNPNGLPGDLFATGEARWLEVQIAGQKPQPRVLLTSVPYALKAADAATLGGLPASAFALAGSAAVANVSSAAITPDAATAVTTTGGTANRLAKFSGSNTIVNSILYDNGTSVGIGTSAPSATLTVDGAMTVTGTSTLNGQVLLLPQGTATASQAYNSQFLKLSSSAYNSSSKSVVSPRFQLQVEPTGNDTASPKGTLNLLASATASAPAETGFYINTNGTIHFAPDQTFPGETGTGTITGVTAGTALTGGGTSGNVTLKLDTTKVPLLAASNHFTASQSVAGSVTSTGSMSAGGQLVSTVATGTPPLAVSSKTMVTNLNANLLGGLAPSAFATLTANNAFGGVQSFNQVGVGTTAPEAQLHVVAAAANNGLRVDGSTHADGSGNAALVAFGGDNVGVDTTGGAGGTFYGGDNNNSGGFPGDGIDAHPGSGINGAFAGYFEAGAVSVAVSVEGDVGVDGTLSANKKEFKIDHPLDPANKYLVHSSVESSEMMNIYTGNVTTDELGLATVKLPEWFESLNTDFRYQLTVIGQFAQAIIKNKIANRQFTIMTNASHVEVSWQITSVRQDAWAKAHPLVVEEVKPALERGLYMHPELYGQPEEKQTQWARHTAIMRRMKAQHDAAMPTRNSETNSTGMKQ